jgi:hypothetical protein
MTKIKFAGVSTILIATICACYWIQWLTLHDFVISIDHGNILFEDLMFFYYPMARNIFSAKLPVPGYFYSAFFAILIFPLGTVSITQAVWIWGIAQTILAGLLGIVSGGRMAELSRANKVFFILLFLTSFPLLHNFKWGQVSVLITLCILAAMWSYINEHSILSGILLAFAVSIKYYPIIFIAYPLLKRDYRFLFAFGASVFAFFCIIPSFALGPLEWVNFEKAVGVLITKANFSKDINSQYFGYVILRMFPLEDTPIQKKILSALLQGIGGLVFLTNIGFIWKIEKRLMQDAILLSTGLLFLSLPFVIQTSWPHYFVYLPFCQTVAFIQVTQNHKPKKGFNLASVPISISCVMSSIFTFNLFPSWSEYNSKGILFISNFLLLLVFYQILFVKYKNSGEYPLPNMT